MTCSRFRIQSIFLACALAIPIAGHSQGLSEELAHLQELVANENALIEGIRRFDRQQQALVEWDETLRAQYLAEDQHALAEAKEQDVLRRIGLIEEAWKYGLKYYASSARMNNYYGEFLYDVKGNIAAAMKYWRLARAMDEDLAAVNNNLGLHYFHAGDYVRGYQYLQQALDLEPKNPDYLFNMVQIYLNYAPQIAKEMKKSEAKIYGNAMEMSREAAEFAPEDFEILQDYATNFYAAENFDAKVDWEEAAAAWRAARPHARTAEEAYFTWLNEGRVWIRAGDSTKAIAALEHAVSMRPDSDIAQQLLAEARQARDASTRK